MTHKYEIIKCSNCESEIAIMPYEHDNFDIDCDCGEVITAQGYKGQYEYVTPASYKPKAVKS